MMPARWLWGVVLFGLSLGLSYAAALRWGFR